MAVQSTAVGRSVARSIPQELTLIIPDLPSVPVQPIILETQREYGMFEHLERYSWVLPIHRYSSPEDLIEHLEDRVIQPAETLAQAIRLPGR